MRHAALFAALSSFACTSAHIEPVVIEHGGEKAFYRPMPTDKQGCFWARLEGSDANVTDQLFLCCPTGAVVVAPDGGGPASPRPVCTKAVWGR